MVFGILGTSPHTDKSIYEVGEQIYDYIRSQWTLTGNLAIATFDDDNKPNPNRNYWIWVRHVSLASDRATINSLFDYIHRFAIYCYGKKSRVYPGEFTELGDMVKEVQRILWQYNEHASPGILFFDGMQMAEVAEVSGMGAAWAKMWEVVTTINARYQKADV